MPASAGDERGMGLIPGLGGSPGGGNGNPLLPGKSHGQRNLVGYNPQDCKELDMTEHPCPHGNYELRSEWEKIDTFQKQNNFSKFDSS